MTFLNRRAIPVVTATPDYSSGDALGTLMSFAQRTPGGGGHIKRLAVKSIDAIAVAAVAYIFDAEPTNTTVTDNSALTINSADRTSLLAAIDIASGDWVQRSPAGLYVADKALDIPFMFAQADRALYVLLTAGGAINLSTVSSLEVILGTEVD